KLGNWALREVSHQLNLCRNGVVDRDFTSGADSNRQLLGLENVGNVEAEAAVDRTASVEDIQVEGVLVRIDRRHLAGVQTEGSLDYVTEGELRDQIVSTAHSL